MYNAILLLLLVGNTIFSEEQKAFKISKLEISASGKGRDLQLVGKLIGEKEVRNMTYGYRLYDKDKNVLEDDRMYATKGKDGILISNGFDGIICKVNISDPAVVSGTMWFDEITFTDGTKWTPADK